MLRAITFEAQLGLLMEAINNNDPTSLAKETLNDIANYVRFLRCFFPS